jgi:DNA-binding ferritin-like protein
MIEGLVSKVFAARNAAHLEHWATGFYAQHVALGDFYDGVIDLIDKLVEAYQGNFGKIKVKELEGNDDGTILEMLEQDVVWINDNRKDIANGVAALENIVDELTGLYLSTIYKLKNLK